MVELTLIHDGRCWVASNGLLCAAAPTLDELDSKVLELLKKNGLLVAGEKLRVLMAFDNATIPEWIRPYAQHYFNRVVELTG